MAGVPSTHYVKSSDVYIAYQVFGEGLLDLIFVPGFVSNIEAMWQTPHRSRNFSASSLVLSRHHFRRTGHWNV
jgi:hypothetical protein